MSLKVGIASRILLLGDGDVVEIYSIERYSMPVPLAMRPLVT
jgi:hypothetical protein